MLKTLAELSQPILNLRPIRRTRRNHGLEHATIHLLSARRYRLSGRSDDSGFILLGEVETEHVEQAVESALRRMKNGEHRLAIHPNCGTNLVTTGFLAAAVSMFSLAGLNRRDAWNRLPMLMMLMMIVVLFSPALGMRLQEYFTTDGDPADMEVISVRRSQISMPFGDPLVVHHVVTHSS